MRWFGQLASLFALLLLAGCATGTVPRTVVMETTAYCPCGECNGYTRGSWLFLKLDFWNRRFVSGPNAGTIMSADTASGADFQVPRPGLFSTDTLVHPWMLPPRLIFPWLWLPRRGTIAADTDYYPFGTLMSVPGWGRGIVTDRGSAIKGPQRLDLLFGGHSAALNWGRRTVDVEIE